MTADLAVPVAVLHEDAHLLAVDKPAGRLVIPGRDGAEPSLRAELEARFGRLWVVHRLDRSTSGVLVLARTAAAHRALNLAFDRGEPRKRYLALVRGVPPEEQRIEVAIAPGRKGRMRPAAPDDPRGKPSATVVRRLEAFPAHPLGGGPLALVEALPETGRTHQIRVHLAALGAPLLGDARYGGPRRVGEVAVPRVMLHAARLELPHPATGARMVFEAAPPEDFRAAEAALVPAR